MRSSLIDRNELIKEVKLKSKTGHLAIFGMPGYGKGNFGEQYVAGLSRVGYKVFDINSQDRGEGMYYSFKQTQSNMTRKIDMLTQGIVRPQKYKSEIVMFCGNNLKKLKFMPANVKVCSFNEEWLEPNDLIDILAPNSENQAGLLHAVFEYFEEEKGQNKVTLTQLFNFFRASRDKKSEEGIALKGQHYLSIGTLTRRIRSILKSGIFYSNKNDMEKGLFQYLDLDEHMRKQDVITSFSTYLVDDEYIRYICIYVLLKKFMEKLEMRKSKVPLCFYIREGNDFFFMKKPPAYALGIQNNISKILRKGRAVGGAVVNVVMDTQFPNDLPDYIYNGFNQVAAFRLPLSEARKLNNKATIHEEYLKKLSRAEVGVYMFVGNGMFHWPVFALPTLHKKAEPNFDVFNYLISLHGRSDYSDSQFLELELKGKDGEVQQLGVSS